MKWGLVISLAAVAGCTSLGTLEDRAESALDVGVNPEHREFHYLREGNTIHYWRRECAGRFCDGPLLR